MVDDVVLNKTAIIERCLQRIDSEFGGHETELVTNLTRQDAIVLNLQCACEAAIDLAMHLVRVHRRGLPQESREAFRLLHENGLIDASISARMQAMVGFRNVAVPNDQPLNLDIVRAIIEKHLDDFRRFATAAVKLSSA